MALVTTSILDQPSGFGTLLTSKPVTSFMDYNWSGWRPTTAAATAPAAPPMAADTTGQMLMTGGLVLGGMGAINSAIGSYFAAESQKNQLKMQAQNQRFAANIAAINARGAEYSAQVATEAGQRAIGRYTMQAGQARAGAVASLAGRGIVGSTGSAREVLGSMDLIKEIDKLTMSANVVRQAEAYRMQAANYQTQATMAGLSAQNIAGTAGTISPFMSASSSLLGSASDIGLSWLRAKRFEELLGGVSTKRFG